MVELNNLTRAKISERWVIKTINEILKKLNKKGDVSLVLVGDREIKKLNKKYRQRNEVTDILSFSNLEGGELTMPKGENYLGEIIIGYEQAKRQARKQGHVVKRELLILLIHGVLHLLGYEHEGGGEQAEVMRKKEVELLGLL